MENIQIFEGANQAPDLISVAAEFFDDHYKKASTARHIRNKIIELSKLTNSNIKIKAEKEDNIFIETYSIEVLHIFSIELKIRAYNELTHVSKKKHIKQPKTFIDLNQQKLRLIKVFGQEIGQSFVALLESVFSVTRTNFLFECEFFDMKEFFLSADYAGDYIDIDINILKL